MTHEMRMMGALRKDAPQQAGGMVAGILRALGGQKAAYGQILALAQRQSGHVSAGDTEALMAVLAARNRIIQEVAQWDRELQPYKGRWQEVLDGLPTADRRAVGELLQEVQRLLSDILAQDERDKEALLRQKAAVGTEITRTVSGAALHRAYGVGGRT
jgi:hypothetical protein